MIFWTVAFFLIGMGEWFLAAERMWHISKGEAKKSAMVVTLENLIYSLILIQIIAMVKANNWLWALVYWAAYSLGAGVGTYISQKVDV